MKNMGNRGEWVEVLFMGAFWGALTFWLSQPIDSGTRRKLRSLSIQVCAVAGFLVGLTTAFGLRSFRWSLVAVAVPAGALLVIIALHSRKRFAQLKAEELALRN